MKHLSSAFTLLVLVFTAASSACGSAGAAGDTDRVERGRYLVASIGCSDCHTPKKFGPAGPEPDESRHLSGHPEGTVLPPAPATSESWPAVANSHFTAWSGPWGVTFTANLTPDTNTGIGIWTEEMFVNAIRTGRHMGTSRPILPPMPWPAFRNLTDEDLKSVFAYLRSIPPIHNRVPDPVPPAGATTTH